MFQYLVKFLFCFTLLLGAEQMVFASAEAVKKSTFETEQVDVDQQISHNSAGFLLIDLSENDYSPSRPDFYRLTNCYKNSIVNYRCPLNERNAFSEARCVSGKFNIPHHNQDKEDPNSFHLGEF